MLVSFEKNKVFCHSDSNCLEVGNGCFKRMFDISSGQLRTVSLQDGNRKFFAGNCSCDSDFQFHGTRCPSDELKYSITDIRCNWIDRSAFDSEHLLVEVEQHETKSRQRIIREILIYPDIPVMGMRCRIQLTVYPLIYWNTRRGLRLEDSSFSLDIRKFDAVMDMIQLPERFMYGKAVEFRGRTDLHDEPVSEREYNCGNAPFEARGNLLFAASTAGDGIFYLQETLPGPESRELEEYDFRYTDHHLISCGWNLLPGEMSLEKEYTSCRHLLALYHSAEECAEVLNDYLKLRFESGKQPTGVLVNPWGCGRFMQLLNDDFLKFEIMAAGECGAEYYQIDDSWQQGGNLGDLVYYNRAIELEDYWQIRPSLCGGSFAPLLATAEKAGIQLSLWCAPSSNIHYRDWRQFVSLLLKWHREYGFSIFKIDGAMIRTYEAEQNMRFLLETSVRESGGEIMFNLDTTHGQRAGYFLFMEYGNIFLENRYVCHKKGLGYHPERTLRNLWRLTKFIRPAKLQIEIPYYKDINPDFYDKIKKESRPDIYPWDYWMAIAMIANPLLWFAPSELPPTDRKRLERMMEIHKQFRSKFFHGRTEPVGNCPDGKSISGFHIHNRNEGNALLLFRERNAEESAFPLPECTGVWKKIAGSGELDENQIRFSDTAQWILLAEQL